MHKKNLFLWSLYDFANSIIFVSLVLYFAQWLVVDGGLSDLWYNATFAVATILLLVTSPALAAYTDRNGGRKLFLNISTFATALCYGLAVAVAFMGTSYVLLAALLFLLGQYCYQCSFVFYDAMIEDVSEPNQRAHASGIGYFFNSLGQFAGVALSLLFTQSRLAPLVPSVIAFFVLSLPMMILFKESRVLAKPINISELQNDAREFFKKFRVFFSASPAVPMLLAFCLCFWIPDQGRG